MKSSTSAWTALKDITTAKRVSFKRHFYFYLAENRITESIDITAATVALTAIGTVINDSGIINASQLSSNAL